MTARMDKRFADLAAEGRPALVTYFMGGDPDYASSIEIMKAPKNPLISQARQCFHICAVS